MWIYIIVPVVAAACFFCFFRFRKSSLFYWTKGIKSEIICEKIIRAVPDMVFILDRSLRVLKLYNPNEEELMVPSERLIGENVGKYLDKKFADMIEFCIQKTIEADGVYEMEYDIETSHGTEYYEARYFRIRKNEFACFVRNITDRKKGELLLEQNQELLNSILDNIPCPFMLKDVNNDFRYIYWNKECDRQSGLNRNEVLGKTDIEIYGKVRGGEYQRINQQVVDEGKPYQNYEIFVTPDGVEHSSIVYKNVISNELHRWLLVARWDISDLVTAEKSLQEANRVNQLILNNANIGFAFIDPDYVIQWENISTYSSHPIICNYKTGTTCYKNVWGYDRPCQDCVMQKAILSGKVEQKVFSSDNQEYFEIMATPVYNESKELQGVVIRIEDVTVKKQIALELKRAKEEAEKSDRLKSSFLANMSHEIRTPLNAILGFSELLCRTEDPGEKETYAEIIKNNNDLLLQLINDILDLSKIEANILEFVYSDVDINALLSDLERSFQFKIAHIPDLKIKFVPGLPACTIHTEKNRFSQVFSNFITNAIKFTAQGEITFGYRVCDEGLYFYVRDTGIGIPEDKQQKIFDRFVKLNTFKTGTGLGLSICQTIVQKLNGSLGVKSEEGKGSTFWFILPCKFLAEEGDNRQEEIIVSGETLSGKKNPEIISGKPTLLIAEDVMDNYKLFQIFLQKDYNLIHAFNGQEAVELFRKYHPNAILMDIKMPEMNGYQATAAIREIDPSIPIIAVTAFAFADDKKRILENGFTKYVTKPITSESLLNTLKEIGV